MADSDDEDTFVTIGTPVDVPEEDAPRKKAVPIHEQIVTDSGGRRRFHGAFTGGFSAGHFNTVGTKEGWTPSTFVSSRSKKGEERQAQRPEDFMDDEDFDEYGIAPKKIVTKQEFLSTTRQELETRRKRDAVLERSSEHGIPGIPPLQDLVVPTRMSIGVDLLKQMGWKEGQGVGARVRRTKKKIYGCAPATSNERDFTPVDGQDDDVFAVGLLFAPKDVEVVTFTPKDDLHGIGYKGIDPTTALSTQQDWLGMDPVRGRTGKMGIRGQAFGVGAFEEVDEDIYTTDNLSKYDIELSAEKSSSLHGWTGPPQKSGKGGLLAIFTKTSQPPPHRKHYAPPMIPKDFKPFHRFEETTTREVASKPSNTPEEPRSAPERGQMLGETPLPTPKKSIFEFVSKEDKARLESVRSQSDKSLRRVSPLPSSSSSSSREGFGLLASTSNSKGQSKMPASLTSTAGSSWSPTLMTGSSGFKPFPKDPAKQARYEEYLRLGMGEKPSGNTDISGLTEWQREREQEEFSRAAMLYRPLSSSMAARFTSAKQNDDPNTVYEEVPEQMASETCDQSKAASMKMFGRLTRDQFEWHPDRLLCKRLNIPDPYPGSSIVGVPKVRKPKFSLGGCVTTQSTLAIAYDTSASADDKKSGDRRASSGNVVKGSPSVVSLDFSSSTDSKGSPHFGASSGQGDGSLAKTALATKEPDAANDHVTGGSESASGKNLLEDEEDEPKRPSMDLFKAIFADSSSEDESERSADEEEDVDKSGGSSAAPEKSNVIAGGANASVTTTDTQLTKGEGEVENEGQRKVETQSTERVENRTTRLGSGERKSPSPETYGPALPTALPAQTCSLRPFSRSQQSSRQFSGSERGKQGRRKDIWKERGVDYSDSEDEKRSKHKRKRKGKDKDKDRNRHKNRDKDKSKDSKAIKYKERTYTGEEKASKHKEKHRQEKKHKDKSKQQVDSDESSEEKLVEEKCIEVEEKCIEVKAKEKPSEKLPDDKDILSKLKNIQALRGRRMRAADFM